MNVKFLNKEQFENNLFFRNWGRFSAECYSEDADNMTDKQYINIGKHCLKSHHFSGSRHLYFQFRIKDISRNCSLQLNRHEIGVVKNQQSQRYVSMENSDIIIPPQIQKNENALNVFINSDNVDEYNYICNELSRGGEITESIKQDARNVLTGSCTTRGCWAFTLEALINACHKRLCTRAQWEIRDLFKEIKIQVIEVVPELEEYLVPYCKYLMWCPEGKKSCGIMPSKDKICYRTDDY